ncbi:MAG: SMI1/KNR4 family protein [Gemmataceae bacterium]
MDAASSDPQTLFSSRAYLAIGDDGGAGQLCLGIKGDKAGKVYYWDRRTSRWMKRITWRTTASQGPKAMFQNVHLIAESFEDFLQRLEVKAD